MPGHSTGTKHKSRPHTHRSGRCRSECCRQIRSSHQDSCRDQHTTKQETHRNQHTTKQETHRNQHTTKQETHRNQHTTKQETHNTQCNTKQETHRNQHTTKQETHNTQCNTKQETYRNQRNTNQETCQNHYTDFPQLINPALPHSPPNYHKSTTSSHRDNHKTNHDSFRNHYAANHHLYDDNQEVYHNHVPSPDRKMSQDSCRNSYTMNKQLFQDQDSQRDPCADPPRAIVIDTQPSRTTSQSCGLISSAPCGSCSWSHCKALICCVLTCGFYGRKQPCVPPNESSTDPPPKSEPETRRPEPRSEPKSTHLPSSGSFRYGDVYIAGKKVVYSPNSDAPARRNRSTAKGESQRPISNTSIYSREDLDVDDVDDGGTDIDSLITKKLLELYKLHQIEQLAKCTSDLSFSRKTNEISDLINSIAQDYNLEEQEAECRLVHGVIRISTRKYKSQTSKGFKSKDAFLQPNGRRDGTLPDSGNETMTFTFSIDEPEMLVSDLTPSDELARKMRGHSVRSAVYSSGLATDSSADLMLC